VPDEQKAIVTPINALARILKSKKRMIEAMLPKHLTYERLISISCDAWSRNQDLQKCTLPSILQCVIHAGQLGLEPNTPLGLCHMVPFWNKKIRKTEAKLIVDYKGHVQLAFNSGKVLDIDAEAVREGDEFSYRYGTKKFLDHTPAPSDARGELTHAWAMAELPGPHGTDKTVFKFVVLDRAEVMFAKSKSAAGDTGPWKSIAYGEDSEDRMWVKTAVHRLQKLIPQTREQAEASALDYAAEAEEAQDHGSISFDAEDFIDATPEDITNLDAGEKSADAAEQLTDRVQQTSAKLDNSRSAQAAPPPRPAAVAPTDEEVAGLKKTIADYAGVTEWQVTAYCDRRLQGLDQTNEQIMQTLRAVQELPAAKLKEIILAQAGREPGE